MVKLVETDSDQILVPSKEFSQISKEPKFRIAQIHNRTGVSNEILGEPSQKSNPYRLMKNFLPKVFFETFEISYFKDGNEYDLLELKNIWIQKECSGTNIERVGYQVSFKRMNFIRLKIKTQSLKIHSSWKKKVLLFVQ